MLFGDEEATLLVAAATLHDIGYAHESPTPGSTRSTGRTTCSGRATPRLAGLVAHHSFAHMTADGPTRKALARAFPREQGPVADALAFCDMHSAPDGSSIPAADRMADIAARHPPGTRTRVRCSCGPPWAVSASPGPGAALPPRSHHQEGTRGGGRGFFAGVSRQDPGHPVVGGGHRADVEGLTPAQFEAEARAWAATQNDSGSTDWPRILVYRVYAAMALGPGKPAHIFARTGQLPLLAGGNADIDMEMLESARFALLIDHDDAEQEYAYATGAEKCTPGPEAGWSVVSMKDDWNQIFT